MVFTDVINPATEKVCAVISLGGKEDIHDAVVAAKEAFNSWGFSTKEEIEADYMDVLKSYASNSDDEDKKGKRGRK